MNRRHFISGLGKFGLTAGAAAAVTSTVVKGRDLAEQSVDGLSDRIDTLKKRLDSLEGKQKKMFKLLIIVTAISAGIDISLLI